MCGKREIWSSWWLFARRARQARLGHLLVQLAYTTVGIRTRTYALELGDVDYFFHFSSIRTRSVTGTRYYYYYRAMHFSAYARSWDRMSSVCLSVTLVDCDHISWKSWKLIARTISPTPSLFVAKRRSTYSQVNMGKFGGE